MATHNCFRLFPHRRLSILATTLFIGPLGGSQAQTFGPPADSAWDSGRHQPVRFIANLDYRNSFIQRHPVNIWGVNAGVEFGTKRHQLTLGYYWLGYAAYRRLIDWRRDAARRINLDYYTRMDLWFMSVMYWPNLINNRHWIVSLPVEVGGGIAYAIPRDLQRDVQIDRTRRDFFVPIQASAYAQWKATRWAGLSAQLGYRQSVFPTDVNQHFNGVYYSVGVTAYPALATDIWRWVTKKDRISPRQPPRPPPLKPGLTMCGLISF